MAKTSTVKNRVSEENKLLKKENMQLRKELDSARRKNEKHSRRVWQKIGIVFFTSLAAAVLVAGNLVFWTGRTLVETKRYAAISSKVIQQPNVQEALANTITDTVFQQVDVDQLLQESLPPRAAFLAEPLASQAQTYTRQTLRQVLGNEKFQDFWQEAQTTIHDRIITGLRNYQGNGVIDLNDIYQRAVSNLADTKLSFLANTKLPASVGSITVVEATWLPTAHNIVVNLTLYRILTILVFLAASVLAILLSRNRRRQIIAMGLIFAAAMLVTLAAIAIAKSQLVGNAVPANQAAVRDISDIVFSSLVLQTRLLLASSLIIAIMAWLSGPYRSATVIRERINLLLAGKLHSAIFSSGENKLTNFIGRHQSQLFWTYTGIVGLLVVFLSLTTARLIAFVVSVALVAIVLDILAAPNKK